MIESKVTPSKRDIDTVLSLLRHRILGVPFGACFERGDWTTDCQEVYSLFKRHDFAHLLADEVRTQGLSVAPEFQQKLQKEKLTAVWRYERQQAEQRRILEALENAGIDHILLKGDVVRQYYPEPWMRTSCDIDVLVHREDLERAEQVLQGTLNYSVEGKVYHDVSMRSHGGVHLELHFSLNVHSARADEKLRSVWKNGIPVEGCSHRYEMAPAFFMFYFVAHMAGHFLRGGCGVRSVLDLYLLEQNVPFEREELRGLLEESGLLKFYNGMHRLGGIWFAGQEEDPAAMAVGEYILVGGIYGATESRIAVSKSRNGGTVKYWYRRLFQSKELLQGTYPQLEKKPYLYPYYQVKRWFRVLKADTRRRIVREARYEHGISDEQKGTVGDVLGYLGIEED